jgi:hypothetical protein
VYLFGDERRVRVQSRFRGRVELDGWQVVREVLSLACPADGAAADNSNHPIDTIGDDGSGQRIDLRFGDLAAIR